MRPVPLRFLPIVFVWSIIAALIWAMAADGGLQGKPPRKEAGTGLVRMDGHGVEWWRWEAIKARQDVRETRRALRRRSSSLEAISLASTTYGVSHAMLLRKARCESGLNPYAANPSSTASGLFQFLDSTWAGTPYGRYSVWSPYANALAAGWMHRRGRGGEWVCR